MTLVTFIALVGIADAEMQIGMGAARGVHALGWDVSCMHDPAGWSIPQEVLQRGIRDAKSCQNGTPRYVCCE